MKKLAATVFMSIILVGCEDKNKDKLTVPDEKSSVQIVEEKPYQTIDSAMELAQSETFTEDTEEQQKDCQPDEIVGTARFVKKSDWEGVECKEYRKHIVESYPPIPMQECIFPNANLRQVYEVIKKLGIEPYLKLELPATDTIYGCHRKCSPCDSVAYKHISQKHLLIRLTYEGDDYTFLGSGNNNIDIIEDGNSTRLKMDDFWDY
jgi:hypothetical protein